jgi:hypothetical protein
MCRAWSVASAALVIASVVSVTPDLAWAQATYKIEPIVRLGDVAGGVPIKRTGAFQLGSLNDRGQIAFVAVHEFGGEALIQYTDGEFRAIVVPGGEVPGGHWPDNVAIALPVSMNSRGNVVFAAGLPTNSGFAADTFRWDDATRQVTVVARAGTPALNGLTYERGGFVAPVISNRDEIAFPAVFKGAEGLLPTGVLFRGMDGQLQAIALPDQELPEGHRVLSAGFPSLDDAGRVVFLVRREDEEELPYLWEGGQLTPLPVIGMDVPGGGQIAEVEFAWLNNADRSILLAASVDVNRPPGLYRWSEESLTPLVVPGQQMPGDDTLASLGVIPGSVSAANDRGQRVLLARLESGTALYLMGLDGALSPILTSGTDTALGKVTQVGGTSYFGAGLNNKGQVAVTIRLEDGVDTIVLLTPSAP